MGCTLLLQNFDLIFIALIGTAADNIDDSTIHTNLIRGIRNKHDKLNAISNFWTARYILIVDKISIVKLEMLSNMEKQLAKVWGLSNSNRAVFGGLPIIIVMGDFHLFLPIVNRFF